MSDSTLMQFVTHYIVTKDDCPQDIKDIVGRIRTKDDVREVLKRTDLDQFVRFALAELIHINEQEK
jgi:hypothetical protein